MSQQDIINLGAVSIEVTKDIGLEVSVAREDKNSKVGALKPTSI